MVKESKSMSGENYVLLNLKDSKEVASALQNDTAKKILDFLTDKEKGATESSISKNLGIALSTVHYNLQQLKKARLVVANEFHYSKKGKEVMHYKLAKKLIIIAPGNSNNWKDLLKKVIPSVTIAVIGSFIIKLTSNTQRLVEDTKTLAMRAIPEAIDGEKSSEAVLSSANMITSQNPFIMPNWGYFLIGAGVVLLTIIFIELIRRK